MYQFYCDDCDLDIEVERLPAYFICPLCCELLVETPKTSLYKEKLGSAPNPHIKEKVYSGEIKSSSKPNPDLRRQLLQLGYSEDRVKLVKSISLAEAIKELE